MANALERAFEECRANGLSRCLERVTPTDVPALDGWTFYAGKVRDNFTSPDGSTRVLVTTDRLSAFDRVLTTLPFKGQVLNELAAHWFDATKHIAPNHVIAVPDPNVVIARACTPLPVEMVMRAYLTGVTSTSIYTHYARGERVFCGHALPDGLVKNQALPKPILTPSSKASGPSATGAHDESMSREQVIASTHMDPKHFDRAAEIAHALFAFGQARAAERGLILADTKYEFGLDARGEVTVIDEIHTPDSSRYWFAGSYEERLARKEEPESFDKEFVRRSLVSLGFSGDGPIPELSIDLRIEASRRYITAFETIVGAPFEPNGEAPIQRIAAAIAGALRRSERGGEKP